MKAEQLQRVFRIFSDPTRIRILALLEREELAVQEIMEVLGGSMDICLAGQDAYTTYAEGESFTVPASSSFKLIIKEPADYCCSYITE